MLTNVVMATAVAVEMQLVATHTVVSSALATIFSLETDSLAKVLINMFCILKQRKV